MAGSNGVGKSTFLKLLSEQLEPDSGTIERGETLVMGIYDQLGIEIEDPQQTMLEFVLENVNSREGASQSDGPVEARRLLNQFEFPRQRWNERVAVLSGGERRRLQMLAVFSKRPNFLLLDEPSVDCDLDTLSALEEYLKSFDGVLLIVSHDRAFADKVTGKLKKTCILIPRLHGSGPRKVKMMRPVLKCAIFSLGLSIPLNVDHIFIFEGGGVIKDFGGTLSEYATTLVELESQAISDATKGTMNDNGASSAKKSTYKEDKARRNEERNRIRRAKRDMDNLEKAIEKLKVKSAELDEEIKNSSEKGWSVLADLTDQLGEINQSIEDKEFEWMTLAEQVEEAEVEV